MNTIDDFFSYCTAGAEPNDGNGGSEQEEQVTCSFVANWAACSLLVLFQSKSISLLIITQN